MGHEPSRQVPLPPAAQARLQAYEALVGAYADRLNLVAPGDLRSFRARHIADSLRALPLLRGAPPGPAIDVGSGAGLPGVPLAIAQPSRLWRLLEARPRRAAFLEEVVRTLELDCEVIVARAQDAARRPSLARAHVAATARALAPPQRAVALLLPFLAPGGAALVFVGARSRIPPGAEEPAPGLAIIRADGLSG